MKEKSKTYKEKIDADKMLDEMDILISTIIEAKIQVAKRAPYLREYIEDIPNAGIFAYNKMNEFVKKLAEKSIDDESVIYAVLKKQLSYLVINDNFNDILGYECTNEIEIKRALENRENKGLVVVKKTTIWQKIKRFINHKIFNNMTDDDMEMLDNYLIRRDEARRKVRDEVIERAEKIYKIELDEEFLSQAILNYVGMIEFQEDCNMEVFKQEMAEELEKLGMQDLVKRIDEKEKEEETFRQRIKFETDNSVQSEPRVAKKEVTERGKLAHGGAR